MYAFRARAWEQSCVKYGRPEYVQVSQPAARSGRGVTSYTHTHTPIVIVAKLERDREREGERERGIRSHICVMIYYTLRSVVNFIVCKFSTRVCRRA